MRQHMLKALALRGFGISNAFLWLGPPISPVAVCHRLEASLESLASALRFASSNTAVVLLRAQQQNASLRQLDFNEGRHAGFYVAHVMHPHIAEPPSSRRS